MKNKIEEIVDKEIDGLEEVFKVEKALAEMSRTLESVQELVEDPEIELLVGGLRSLEHKLKTKQDEAKRKLEEQLTKAEEAASRAESAARLAKAELEKLAAANKALLERVELTKELEKVKEQKVELQKQVNKIRAENDQLHKTLADTNESHQRATNSKEDHIKELEEKIKGLTAKIQRLNTIDRPSEFPSP